MELKNVKITCGMLCSLLIGYAVLGCAINPVTKRPNFVLISTKGERQIGVEEALKVEQTIGLMKPSDLTAYVKSLGQRLAAHSPRKDVEYHFNVVDTIEPNAFALPGGFVYVSRGLLALTNSEDELAGVLGHEIGHVAARHSVQRLSAASPFALVGGITGAVTGIVSDRLSNLVTGVAGLAGGLVLSPYSRGQEHEADRIGIKIVADTKLDPMGLSRFLKTLQREEEFRLGKTRETSYFDSHPSTPKRIENTEDQAQAFYGSDEQPRALDSSIFLQQVEGLVIGSHPAQGVFVENRYLHPDLNVALQFPDTWGTHINPQAVLAVEKEQALFSMLQVTNRGLDPMIGPRALNEQVEGNLLEQVEKLNIQGFPATRVVLQMRTKQGPAAIDFTWVAYKGLIYQIIGGGPLDYYEKYMPTFRQIAQSFRPLTSEELNNIKITRLRLVHAQDGETLRDLNLRAANVWTVKETAVVNGLPLKAILKKGQLVKVARQERYLPQTD